MFIAFSMEKVQDSSQVDSLVNEIIDFVHAAEPVTDDGRVYYPGERTLLTRKENLEKGIPVNEAKWKKMVEM